MARTFTSDELIAVVRRRARMPNTQAEGAADTDILAYMDEAIMTDLVPFMIKLREDYLIVTTATSVTSGTYRYRLPDRASGLSLREVKFSATNDPQETLDVTKISREHTGRYASQTGQVGPLGFYLEGVDIVLVPHNFSQAGTLYLAFAFRPSQLVTVANAGAITSVDTSAGTVTCSAGLPTAWTASNKFDIHAKQSGAEVKVWSASVSSVNHTTEVVTFSDAIDGSVHGTKAPAVGDYICLENECVVPALPIELQAVAAQATVVEMLESQGDLEGAALADKKLMKMYARATEALETRVEGEQEAVVNPESVMWGGGRRFTLWG